MKTEKPETINSLVSYGSLVLSPVEPGPRIKDLCERIDEFYSYYPDQYRKQKPSDLIIGVFYAMRPECRSNPDWMSQAANSAREILYPLFANRTDNMNLIRIFKKYATETDNNLKQKGQDFFSTFNLLDSIYKKLNDITHHGTKPKGFSKNTYDGLTARDFENLIDDFTSTLFRAFSLQQTFTHEVINLIIQKQRMNQNLKEDLKFILHVNDDARQYFFYRVNKSWLSKLWTNNFLDVIKAKAKDPTRYSYTSPELNYLVRVAITAPQDVTNIMLKVPISKNIFNPEVVDQFLRICGELPAKQLARITAKIRDEKWVQLMGYFNQHGFEFEKMFKTLLESKDYDNILVLAQAVLLVRTKKEIKEDSSRSITENPFYFSELSYTKVFKYLTGLDGARTEQALELVSNVFTKATTALSKKLESDSKHAFKVYDSYILADVDFFSLKMGDFAGHTPRGDIRELAVTFKALLERTIGLQCNDPKKAHSLYEKYVENLPDCQSVWRLKLYVLSLCPKAFTNKLKQAIFAIFNTPNYPDLIAGAEYKTLLQKSFASLSKNERGEYVRKALELFGDNKGSKEDIEHLKHSGSRIFSTLNKQLTVEQKKTIKAAGFEVRSDYKPTPIIGKVTGGTVVPQAPISQDEFDKLPVAKIAENFKTTWTPEKLDKADDRKDHLRPLNGEGAGTLLQNGILKRLQDFIDDAELFFDRDRLDPHYTYSFLRGVESEVKNNKELSRGIKWDKLILLLVSIKDSGNASLSRKPDKSRDRYSSWLADWNAVHSLMASLIEEMLREVQGKAVLDLSKYRSDILSVIEYLLCQEAPRPREEKPAIATMTRTSPGQQSLVTEPYMMAINSVRGRAFEAFIMFVYQDGKEVEENPKIKLAQDVKDIYKRTLGLEQTKALMFMFGRYVPTFYYRDTEWVNSLVAEIFPAAPDKSLLYLAAWEGYLSNNLFKEIFHDPKFQKLYKKGLVLRRSMDPVREFFKDPEEGIAVHLALAYVHYDDFGFDTQLFKDFWKNGTERQHSEFIGFIGRKYLSKEDGGTTIKNEPKIKKRLDELWDWVLNNYKHSSSLKEFGYWVNSELDVFDPAWLADHTRRTLEVTKGELGWDYGLQKSVAKLAEACPKDTLEILRLTLLEYGVRKANKQRPIFFETEWSQALAILYAKPETKNDIYQLIDDLIREGGSPFWPLKEVLDKQE